VSPVCHTSQTSCGTLADHPAMRASDQQLIQPTVCLDDNQHLSPNLLEDFLLCGISDITTVFDASERGLLSSVQNAAMDRCT
jgi:hypothetical protein